jgi:hypothetical protein
VACTALNAILLARSHFSTASLLVDGENLPGSSPLPRPNQYIGLDTVNRTEHPFTAKPMANYAPLLTQVSPTDPARVFPVDSRRWFSRIGTLSPDDRHFYVEDGVHTVAQFQTHDYGMEQCELAVVLSAVDSSDSRAAATLSAPTTTVDVWRLDVAHALDPLTLSWGMLKPRTERVGRLEISEGGTTNAPRFHCARDTFQTFLFVCAEPGCRVDFWQDKREPRRGAACLTHCIATHADHLHSDVHGAVSYTLKLSGAPVAKMYGFVSLT